MTEREKSITEAPRYTVRWLEENEVPQAFSIFKDMGMGGDAYTLSEEIIKCWYKVDPKGFYVAVDEKGNVFGICAAIRQNENLVFIGSYAVRRQYQSLGIGVNIWKAMLKDIGPLNASVNSIPEMFEECKDIGCFPIESKWCSSYWYSSVFDTKKLVKSIPHVTIKEIKKEDMDDIIAYDANIVGFARPNIVSTILWENESFSIVALVEEGFEEFSEEEGVSSENLKLATQEHIETRKKYVCGYGCIKANMVGSAVVCPLYANRGEVAELLVARLVSNFPPAKDKGLCLMVTEKNENAMILATKMNLSRFLGLPRVWRKKEIEADYGKIYGQYSLDFSVF